MHDVAVAGILQRVTLQRVMSQSLVMSGASFQLFLEADQIFFFLRGGGDAP